MNVSRKHRIVTVSITSGFYNHRASSMPEPASIPHQQTRHSGCFPVAWIADDSETNLDHAVQWVIENAGELTRSASENGAVLFRGLPIHTAEDFDRFVTAFGYDNFEYRKSLSNAVRTNFTERIFSANEAPAEVTIYLHHEMAQTPVFPSKLFFFCLLEAKP